MIDKKYFGALLTDGYKLGHHLQYPEGTELVYSNFTPRSNRHAPQGIDKVLVVGMQACIKQIHDVFDKYFFSLDREEVEKTLKYELETYTGSDYDVSHFIELYDLGYLPIKVKSLPEGVEVGMGIPVLTIQNTLPEFYWVTNYLETVLSNVMWVPTNSATLALQYRRILEDYADKTDPDNKWVVKIQAHDFSMRGMMGLDATIFSGMGHAFVFNGSDNLPVITAMRHYYQADGAVIGGVPATEHSVMCAGTKDGEIDTFERLLDIYPKGILSVVSDTWDLWTVLTEYLPKLKDKIMARDGKLVIRPDSGDPVDIVCGAYKTDRGWELPSDNLNKVRKGDPEFKGVIELLWDEFGGTVNEQGYKVLDPHIGAIYGDSITLDRCKQICERLESKGFASTNIIFGVGSFTYQYNTRDTFGWAMKATYIEVNGEGREIFKNPITDSGDKTSAKGLLRVDVKGGEYVLEQECTRAEENGGELELIYEDGEFIESVTMEQVRKRIDKII